MSKLQPLNDHLLVKRTPKKDRTQGGIFIPESAKEQPLEGEVLAVGSGKRTQDGTLVPLEVSVGQTVIFTKYAGAEVSHDGEDYLLLREEDVLAVLTA